MKTIFVLSLYSLLLLTHTAFANEDVRRLLLLVDYIGSDYGKSVQEGKVSDPQEYREMQDFSGDVVSLSASLPPPPDPSRLGKITRGLQQLQHLIENRGEPSDVAALARQIKNATITLYEVETFPLKPPSLKKAKRLYTENCAVCHGDDGSADTTKAKELHPRPTNFRDSSIMEGLSPFKAFNVISFGISGTGMASFDALSEADRWNLAFYLFSLRFSPSKLEQGRILWQPQPKDKLMDLNTLASLTDGELLQKLAKRGIAASRQQTSILALLRTEVPGRTTLDPLVHALALVTRAQQFAEQGKREEAYRALGDAYLEGFELVEPELQAAQPARKVEIEKMFLGTRKAVKDEDDLSRAIHDLIQLRAELIRVRTDLAQDKTSAEFAFFNSLIIILREGLEAALIVAAFLALLRTTEQRKAITYVHMGWVGAIGASFLTWFIAEFLITIGGPERELVEAITSLVAAAVLFYVSYWLLAKLEVQKWRAYLQTKVRTALSTGHMITLAGVSFLAVYREGLETVLFYQALLLHSSSAKGVIFLGFTTGAGILLGVVVAIFKLGLKMPLRYFFGLASALMYLLATTFSGEGINRLQQLDFLPRTSLNIPAFPTLGIYPNAEGLMVQGGLLLLFAGSLFWLFVVAPRTVPSSKSL
ncbi:MAG: FTR1 family protein [Candidatus Binatia bacterium]